MIREGFIRLASLVIWAAAPGAVYSVLFDFTGPEVLGWSGSSITLHPESSTASFQAPGTRRMAKRLERIAATSDTRYNVYLNDRRARLIRQDLGNGAGRADFRVLYPLAHELVLSGQTEEAIKVLKRLEKLTAGNRAADAYKRRAVAELLGIAYMRLGEQQNCIHHHTIDSCLLPIRGGGVHENQEGSRQAIAQFEKVLTGDPENVSARWLLNLAYMTVGGYPRNVPSRWLVPEDTFQSAYDIKRFPDRAGELGLDVNGLAGGVVVEDLDRDGDLDILCSSWGLRDQVRLFRNDGDGTFSDRTDESGLIGIVGGLNLVHADYDSDGLPDVLVLRGAWLGEAGLHPNSLLKNKGDLIFEDVTEKAGLLSFHPTQTAAWADYDNDGSLDLYIGNESGETHKHPAELFHNNGDGTFTECAAQQGVAAVGYVKAVVWGDYNNDSLPDLYVSRLDGPNLLYRNDGPADEESTTVKHSVRRWRFTEIAGPAGVSEPDASFPAWFFDYDNDGWLDIFVSGYRVAEGDFGVDYMELEHRGEPPRLYKNNGDGTFSNVTRQVGVDRLSLTMGSNFGDLDNDGFLDFYLGTGAPDLRALVPNRMYRNDSGKRFQDVTTTGGFGHVQKGHGVAFADIDHDGDQDIYAVMGGSFSGDVYRNVLFENPGHGNRWIALELEGTRSNRSAIGARIRIQVEAPLGRRNIYAVVSTGGSFGSTSLRKVIGLGDASSIAAVEIWWPSSKGNQVLHGLPLDHLVHIREGESEPRVIALEPISLGGMAAR